MVSPKLVFLLFAGLMAFSGANAGDLICCSDPVTGRRVCGDSLPDQCKGRAYKVLDSAGNVIKEVGPPLTSEQKAEKEAEAKRKKELEAARKEQQRKDAALLETYPTLNDIEISRNRAEAEVITAMKQAEQRVDVAGKRRKKFADEAEFYKKREMPPEVARGLKDAEDEIRAQKTLLESKQKDLESVRAKFAEDKRRYLEITAGGRAMHPAATRAQ
ncbi:MAG: hypothetical protein ACM3SV_05485 [Betaproteobacteria bacterium]